MTRRTAISFGGNPNANKRRTPDLLFRFAIQTYQSCRHDIKRLHIKTKIPAAMTYSSVLSGHSVRIAPKIAARNDYNALTSYIHNAYLKTDCRERVSVVVGPKFGSENGNNMLMRKVLYGLKSSGAAFRDFLSETLDAMGYRPIYANPDLWLRPAVRLDGFKYY